MKFLVLQHGAWEGPGQFLLDSARRLKIELEVCKVWQEAIPDPRRGYDALLILGGGANVDQEEQFPFLREEKAMIRRAVTADLPCLGICLGHQLLAEALGAKIGRNFRSSIGFIQGHLTQVGRQHPVFANCKQPAIPLYKWHGYTVLEPLPRNLTLLLTSDHCQVEAISVIDRPHLLGLQSDNHAAAPRDVALWLEQDREWLADIRDQQIKPAQIVAAAQTHAKEIARDFHQLLSKYRQLIRH